MPSPLTENKQVLQTHSDYPQEKTFHVLVLRLSAKLFATQASWKSGIPDKVGHYQPFYFFVWGKSYIFEI